VLARGAGGFVVQDLNLGREAGEDAPHAAVRDHVVADDDTGRERAADAGAGAAAEGEAVDNDIIGVFDVDAIAVGVAGRVDDHVAAVGLKGDGGAGRAGVDAVKTGIGAVHHQHRLTGHRCIGRRLNRRILLPCTHTECVAPTGDLGISREGQDRAEKQE